MTPFESIIVTAANNQYYRTLYQFLLSIKRHSIEKKSTIIIYDLGLLPKQVNTLKKQFLSPNFLIRPYKKITEKEQLTKSWKAPIIQSVLNEFKQPTLWLDSATVILKSLNPIFKFIEKTGLYVTYGGSRLNIDGIHLKTIHYLNIDDFILNQRQHASGFCGFNTNNKHIMNIVTEWARLSQIPDCISPKGASLKTHRYDQSILSYLLYKNEDQGTLKLTQDELDISSMKPIPYARTRNKVPNWIPIWMDPFVRAYFKTYRFLDVLTLRIKHLLYSKN